MGEQRTPTANALDPVEAVAAAMARLGEATAAAIAEEAGQGYSTVTARLRTLEANGRAERTRGDDQRTYWRLLPTTTPPTPADAPADPPQDAALDGHTAATSPTAAQADLDPDTGSTSARKHSNDQDVAAPTTPAVPDEDVPPALGSPAPPVPAAESPTAPAGEAIATTTEPARAEPGVGGATDPASAGPDGNADEPGGASTTDSPGPETTAATPAQRRPAGHLGKVALSIMRANPDTVYTVTQMTRLIDEADAALGYSKASQGAVVLALDGLAKKGEAVRLPQDKAQFKLAPPGTDATTRQTTAP